MADLVPFTQVGFDRLSKELHQLKTVDRPEVIEAIAVARSHGDLKENAEYHAAREKQGFIEARLAILEDQLSRAQVIEYEGKQFDTIKFAAHVSMSDEETGEQKKYQIVGHLEADIKENKISAHSPLARALLGKSVDDLVEIKAPGGVKEYVVTGVKYN